MRDECRVVEGELVEETTTGRLVPVKKDLVFRQSEPLIPISQKLLDQVSEDMKYFERKMLERFGWIGSCYEPACVHGIAMDVHCCNCHSGFLFFPEQCVCGENPQNPRIVLTDKDDLK